MRRSLLCLVLVLLWVPVAPAQNIELFGGYSHLETPRGTDSQNVGLNGWNVSAAANFRSIGIVGDLSQHYGASAADLTRIGSGGNGFTYLFGPQYSFRMIPKVHLFAHALVGGVNGVRYVAEPTAGPSGAACPTSGCSGSITEPDRAFTLAIGGGIDVKAKKHVWIRLAQLDYVRENFSFGAVNTPRFSAGVVFRFGH